MSPTEFASACIQRLSSRALRTQGRVGQEMQMMGVIWFILQADTNNVEHPGKIQDYAANTDFAVNLHVDAIQGEIVADIVAKTWFNA